MTGGMDGVDLAGTEVGFCESVDGGTGLGRSNLESSLAKVSSPCPDILITPAFAAFSRYFLSLPS